MANNHQDVTVPPDRVWVLAIRGIVAILFGLAAVFWPGLTLVTLVYLFSALVLVTGLVTLVTTISRIIERRGTVLSQILHIVLAVLEIGVGIYLLRHTGVSFETFILLIGAVLIVRGLLEVVGALYDQESPAHKTMEIIGGIAAALAGVIILFQPVAGGVAFVWILGLYALITGPLLLALSLSLHKDHTPPKTHTR